MIIRNTSRHDTKRVRELVKWATSPIDMAGVCVNVKGCSHAFGGMAYDYIPRVSNAPKSCTRLVTVRIGDPSRFPVEQHRYPGTSDRFPTYDLRTWEEALVMVAAHEACHVEQYRENLSRSELRCERFALGRLTQWRKTNTHNQGELTWA